jgi:hypothetical protein
MGVASGNRGRDFVGGESRFHRRRGAQNQIRIPTQQHSSETMLYISIMTLRALVLAAAPKVL